MKEDYVKNPIFQNPNASRREDNSGFGKLELILEKHFYLLCYCFQLGIRKKPGHYFGNRRAYSGVFYELFFVRGKNSVNMQMN